jgi:hypothetical protein
MKGRVIAFALVAGLAFGSTMVLAQTKGGAGGGRHHRPGKPSKTADAAAPTEQPKAEETAATAAARDEDRKEKVDGGVLESKTLDGGTRVFRFGEVEIEGRLRNPQLVYFLRRVRAEFAAGDLGHRTFMRELSETRNDPSF